MKRIILFIFFVFVSLIVLASPPRQQSFSSWLKDLRIEAISQGIKPQLFDSVFQGMTPSAEHLQLDRKQPEKRITFLKYRDTRGDAYRIKLGRQEYLKHKQLLDEVGHKFGVDPCFIVALWGLETSYGRYMGHYPVIRSLATLAYDTRRSQFFRKELLLALHILNEGHVSLKDFKGEWAGASGQPQFLPSSWHNFAVDYNNDNRKDIWHNYGDIFASIANYLVQNGWQNGEPWAIEISVPYHFDQSLLTLNIEKSVSEWEHLGVKPKDNYTYLNPNLMASIIEPYGGPYLMVFNNFKTLMKWNRSTYYAGTIGYMAEKICS